MKDDLSSKLILVNRTLLQNHVFLILPLESPFQLSKTQVNYFLVNSLFEDGMCFHVVICKWFWPHWRKVFEDHKVQPTLKREKKLEYGLHVMFWMDVHTILFFVIVKTLVKYQFPVFSIVLSDFVYGMKFLLSCSSDVCKDSLFVISCKLFIVGWIRCYRYIIWLIEKPFLFQEFHLVIPVVPQKKISE